MRYDLPAFLERQVYEFRCVIAKIGDKKREAPLPFLKERSSLKLYYKFTKINLVMVIFLRVENREQRREMKSV